MFPVTQYRFRTVKAPREIDVAMFREFPVEEANCFFACRNRDEYNSFAVYVRNMCFETYEDFEFWCAESTLAFCCGEM